MAKALYKQIYENLRDNILSGNLADGERMPSKRALAEEYSLSDYCHDECKKDALAFNFAGMRDDDIDLAIARLASELKEIE